MYNQMPQQPQTQQQAVPQQAQPMSQATNAAGPQQAQNIGFNQEYQNILFTRIQSMTEQEMDLIDQALRTPQTVAAFKKLLVELAPLLDEATVMDRGMGNAQTMNDYESSNPMTADQSVSRGLVG